MKGLLACLGLGLLLVASCSTPSTKSLPNGSFRVMTYNIHHGEGLDGKVDLERIANLIKREGADIVALQEVDKGVVRTQRRDLPAELAALTGMTAVFSNNFHYQGGEYGNAVLTRFPITHWTNRHYQMLRPNEQRGVLQLSLAVHGEELLFLNTHLDHRPDDAERLLNVAEIKSLMKCFSDQAVILCGDFNSTPESHTHTNLSEAFHDTWQLTENSPGFTYPAANPSKRIDYIWLSKSARLKPIRAWVMPSDGSDHLPLLVEFQRN